MEQTNLISYITEPPSCKWIHAPTRRIFSLHFYKARVCFVSPEQIQETSVTVMNALKTLTPELIISFVSQIVKFTKKRWGQELILCIFTTGVLPFFHVSAAGKQTHGCNRFWENPVEVVQGFGLVHIPVVSIFCWVFLTDTCVCVSVAICCIYMCMRIKQGGVYAFCWVTSFYINGILSEMSLTWQLAWMWMYYLLFDSTTST